MRGRRELLAILAASLWGAGGLVEAQVLSQGQMLPPAGYPYSTSEPLPNTNIGPSSGLVAPGVSTVPRRTSPSSTGSTLAPTHEMNARPSQVSPPGYWSGQSAIRDAQQRLGLLDPTAAIGSNLPSLGGATSSPGLPPGYGLSGSGLGLDAVADYLGTGRRLTQDAPGLSAAPAAAALAPATTFPVPTAQAGAAPAAATAAAEPDEQLSDDFGVPFEQFDSYEEFRAWLTEQLSQPGGGAVGRALAQLEATESPQVVGLPGDQGREPQAASWHDRPPIGYVGVGSKARTTLGSIRFGPDTALESSRLVAELNQYLQSQRPRPRRPSATAANPPQSTAQAPGALPPPRSNLGMQLERQRRSQGGRSAFGGTRGGNASADPGQYFQNLGGYTPPPAAVDWPPSAGY